MSGTAQSEPCVLAIDPGSVKCGMAVVQRSGQILHQSVIATVSLAEEAASLIQRYRPIVLLVGTGTGSKPMLRALAAMNLTLPIVSVDEAHTSESARTRFVAENPPKGLQRWLPRSLRTPPRPYDDYVAVILAERYWQASASDSPSQG